MSEGWNIAVLGATGAVGEALLETLAERQFQLGKFLHWHVTKAQANNCALVVRQSPCRMPLNSTGRRRSWHFCRRQRSYRCRVEEADQLGFLVIDSSGLFALEPDVPLVVPEVNPFVLTDYRNRNVIAVPDSLTSQLLAALKPLINRAVYHVSALPA
ncbi:hypothetical protein ACVXHB_07310 [Escherichia coli]